MDIDHYLSLVKTALDTMSDEDIDALDAYETEFPEVIDAAYQAGRKNDVSPYYSY